MRTPLIAGNWKMNTSLADAHLLAGGILNEAEHLEHIEIVLCPPAVWLAELAHHEVPPRRLPHLKLGAQNMYHEESGAFTGEISPLMVKELAEYVILGHSERTHVFGERPELISHKVQSALQHGITPILCIGEDEQGPNSIRHLAHSLDFIVRGLSDEELEKIVVAYEPVWAIGSGNPATPEYAQNVAALLRERLSPATRILYGGSVTPENAKGFLAEPDIDGLLIGGTSLKLAAFVTVCKIADDLVVQAK